MGVLSARTRGGRQDWRDSNSETVNVGPRAGQGKRKVKQNLFKPTSNSTGTFLNHSSTLYPIPQLPFQFLKYLEKERAPQRFCVHEMVGLTTLSFYVWVSCYPPGEQSQQSGVESGGTWIGDRHGVRN